MALASSVGGKGPGGGLKTKYDPPIRSTNPGAAQMVAES